MTVDKSLIRAGKLPCRAGHR